MQLFYRWSPFSQLFCLVNSLLFFSLVVNTLSIFSQAQELEAQIKEAHMALLAAELAQAAAQAPPLAHTTNKRKDSFSDLLLSYIRPVELHATIASFGKDGLIPESTTSSGLSRQAPTAVPRPRM